MKKVMASALFGLIGACGGGTDGAAPATDGGGNPPSGFYALTITTTADTCTPARVKGDLGTVLVSATGDIVNIPLPFADAGPAVSGWPRQDVHGSGASLNDFRGCTGSTIDIAIAQKSGDAFEVDLTEHWTGIAACTSDPSVVPTSDCTATRKLELRLIKACPATVGGVSC